MHIAVIMDGNGRWAARRSLPRTAGHRAGAKAVNALVECAARRGIGVLTLYAFSADNWTRPRAEVSALFALFRRHLITQTERCIAQDIRLNVIGRRDRLGADLLRLIERSEQATSHGRGMHLRIAIDYSSQHSLLEVSRRLRATPLIDAEQFLAQLAAVDHSSTPVPEVDLLIRTGGEQRLSDFLLWECAYAELYFTSCAWPDFDAAALDAALADYARRERRFGQVGVAQLAAPRHA
jgi:undecaprenyl diphosphate synthase